MALVASAFAGSTALDPASSQRARTDDSAPVKYNLNQIGLDPNTGKQVGGGLVSVPHGNPVFAQPEGGGGLTNLVPGQFRPSAAGIIDPSTRAKNIMSFLTGKQELSSELLEDPETVKLIQEVMRQLSAAGSTNMQPNTQVPSKEQRKINQTYNTPKGFMKWTGTGWVTP
jgi:hypothetical protein